MSSITASLPTLADRVRPIAADGAIVGVHFFGDTPVFVLGEEALLFAPEQSEKRVRVHGGAILSSASDGERIVTGGDDGKVMVATAGGAVSEYASDDKKRWVDQLALLSLIH